MTSAAETTSSNSTTSTTSTTSATSTRRRRSKRKKTKSSSSSSSSSTTSLSTLFIVVVIFLTLFVCSRIISIIIQQQQQQQGGATTTKTTTAAAAAVSSSLITTGEKKKKKTTSLLHEIGTTATTTDDVVKENNNNNTEEEKEEEELVKIGTTTTIALSDEKDDVITKQNTTTNISDTTTISTIVAKNAAMITKADTTTNYFNFTTRIPNLLFAGAGKAGTTSISYWLMDHSEGSVCFGNGQSKKETNFFNKNGRYSLGLHFYQSQFQHCDVNNKPHKYIIDATPGNLRHAQRIHDFYSQDDVDDGLLKSLKVFFSLREPIARELSWYNHKVRTYSKTPNPKPKAWYARDIVNPNPPRNGSSSIFVGFDDYVDKMLTRDDGSLLIYYRYLQKWFELFDRENMLLLSFDEMHQNKNTTEWRLKEFLGLQDEMDGKGIPQINTVSDSIPGQVYYTSCATQEKLSQYYIPMNNNLYKLLQEHHDDGPSMEQYPFPTFRLSKCVDKHGNLHDNYTATSLTSIGIYE